MNIDLNPLFSQIEKLTPKLENKLACFDADGTLWPEDVDLSFLEHQLENKYPINLEVIQKAQDIFQKDHTKACSLLAQRHKNIPLDQFKKWSHKFFKKNPLTVFPFQKEILSFLKKSHVEIYVISASPELIVKEAVKHYKLPVDHVIGIKTLISDNIITDELQLPVSVGPGKAVNFLKQSGNTKPFFVSGNTMSDLKLLELSTHFKFVITSAKETERQYKTERELLDIAKQKSWAYLDLLNKKTNIH